MAKPLVIVESKAKADTIAGFLGRDRFTVKPSVGHVRDLPSGAKQAPKGITNPQVRRLGIDVDDHFRPVYIVPENKKHVVAELKAALKDASELYLATDEDREGEAISWHLLEVLKPKVPVKRMVFHEITREAIDEAIDNWRDLDMKLVEAQEGRRILDRLVGYEVSNVAFRRIGRGTSVGRVQSVATRLVVDRERARMAFRSGSYWDLEGTFHPQGDTPGEGGQDFPATLVELDGRRLALGRDFDADTGALKASGSKEGAQVALLTEDDARALAARLADTPFTVASVDTKQFMERPKAPFITSTLQQEAGRKLGFSAGRTMSIAQGLYERGLITYMRTDSTSLSEQAVRAARTQIAKLYGDAYLPAHPREYRSKVKNAQEAHEAIRPAGDRMRTTEDVGNELRSTDERRLYDLIWKRTVASQMADARIQRVTLKLAATSSAGEDVTFQASGRTIEFPGYLRAYVEGADDPDAELEDRETLLPPLAERESVGCRDLPRRGPHHAAAGPFHRGVAGERARGARHRSPVHLRVGHRDDPRARLRLQEGHRAGAHVEGVREGAAARALLRPPDRLRLHRDDGGSARRGGARRGRSREVARQLLLRQRHRRSTHARAARPGVRRAPRADRHGRGQLGAHRHRHPGQRADRAGVAQRRAHRARRREGADPRRPRARRAHARAGRGAPGEGRWRSAGARRGSRDRPHGARAHGALRPLRPAR